MSEKTAWVVPQASPSKSKYHTDPDCFNVTDRHIEKPQELIERTRIQECSFCAGTADSQDHSYDSPARQLKSND